MKNLFLSISIFCITCFPVIGQIVDSTLWQVGGGAVNTMLKDGNTMYLGGSFTSVSSNTGCFSVLNESQIKPALNKFQLTPGVVYAIISDENGGWFIGGDFVLSKGGKTFNDLLHVQANGEVDLNFAFTTSSNSSVKALYLRNKRLYVGGKFTSFGAQYRTNIAEIDLNSGQVTTWNPTANNDVNAIAGKDSRLYIGGLFTNLNGQAVNQLACIDLDLGISTNFKPVLAGGNVNTLMVFDSLLYVGGTFTSINSQPRNRIAAFRMGSGNLDDWNPDANSSVNALAASGTKIYAGGDFTSIGGFGYNRLVALDKTSGAALPWVPNPDGSVYALSVAGDQVYVAGAFNNIGGKARKKAARIGTAGSAESWEPGFNLTVRALLVSGSQIAAGGNFSSSAEYTRNRLAAIDLSSGEPTAWNPNADGTVNALEMHNDTVYVGGSFNTVGGIASRNMAGVLKQSGANIGWNPNATDIVRVILRRGDMLYIGGNFNSIGAKSNAKFAEYNTGTRTVTSLNIGLPTTSGRYVSSIVLKDSLLYIGGYFQTVKGTSRNNLALINLTSNTLNPWNPNVNNIVSTMSLKDTLLYIGGAFSTVSGNNRGRLAAISVNTGLPTAWNPNANSTVNRLQLVDTTMYLAGVFTTVTGVSRPYLALVGLGGTGELKNWVVSPNAALNDLLVASSCGNDKVYIGGSFTQVGTRTQSGFAAISGLNNLVLSAEMNPVTCGGLSDGSISVTANGAGAPFQYSLDNSTFQPGNTFSGLSAGNYIVYVKNASACVMETYVNVTEPTPLVVSAVIEDEDCSGNQNGSISLSSSGGSGPYTYLWTGAAGNGATLTGLAGGEYRVKVTDSRNCAFLDTFTVGSTPLPFAAFSYSVDNGELVLNNETAGDSNLYTWSFGDNNTSTEQSPTHTYTESGTYQVCLQASNACGSDSTCKQVLVTVVGIESPNAPGRVQVFPNPADNYIELSLENSVHSAWKSFIISDLSGRAIQHGTLSDKGNTRIALDWLRSGIYQLTLIGDGQSLAMPILKK